jgi:hypothetical protein
MRFQKEVLRDCITFILGPTFALTLSWGTRPLLVGGTIVDFPSIMRRLKRSHIVSAYLQAAKDAPHIGATSVMKVLNMLTKREMKSKTAVDVVYCSLVLEPLEILRRMICGEIVSEPGRKECLIMVEAIERFLKVSIGLYILGMEMLLTIFSPDSMSLQWLMLAEILVIAII